MLLSSLREVISNQAQEIQTLQKSVKDLTASTRKKDDEVRATYQPSYIPGLLSRGLDCVSESPGRITAKASNRRRGEEEGE